MAFHWSSFLLLFAAAFLAEAQLRRDEIIARCKGVSRQDLEPCIIQLINDMKPNFANGMPEFNLPTLNELEFGGLNVTDYQDDNNYLHLYMYDTIIKGLEEMELTKLQVDYEKLISHWEVTIPEIFVQAKYEIDSYGSLIRLQGQGTMWSKLKNVNISGEHAFKSADEQNRLIIESNMIDITPEHVAVRLNNIYNDSPILKEAAEAFLNENGQEIFHYMKPKFQTKLNQIMKEGIDRMLLTLPLSDIAGNEFINKTLNM